MGHREAADEQRDLAPARTSVKLQVRHRARATASSSSRPRRARSSRFERRELGVDVEVGLLLAGDGEALLLGRAGDHLLGHGSCLLWSNDSWAIRRRWPLRCACRDVESNRLRVFLPSWTMPFGSLGFRGTAPRRRAPSRRARRSARSSSGSCCFMRLELRLLQLQELEPLLVDARARAARFLSRRGPRGALAASAASARRS